MNRAILMGRLTKEIELKYTQSNMAVARYTLAIDSGYGDKKRTDFINCVAFDKAGEFASKYFHKGQRVLVEGRIQIDEKDGKYYTSIIVNNQEFADGKVEEKPKVNEQGFEEIPGTTDDEELPFQ